MPVKKLKDFLDHNEIKYVSIQHSTAYTSQEIAAAAHIPGKELAKCVIVKINDKMAMVVLPASHEIDMERFKSQIHAETLELASEHEFEDLFPGCEVGAMPPFGNLWGVQTYVSDELSHDEIGFEAGSHREVIKMSYQDYERLVEPRKLNLSYKMFPRKSENVERKYET